MVDSVTRVRVSAMIRRLQTFKEFMMSLPEDISPAAAQDEYKQYQAQYWGSEVRAEFEARRNDPACVPLFLVAF